MKYYIINNKVMIGDLDPELFNYPMLNEEQIVFYKANPNVSLQEILDCKLIEPYIPTLEESIRFKVDAFSREAFESRERILPDYKITNSSLGIYDQATTNKILNTVVSYRTEFYRLKALCEACTSIEELDAVHSDYSSITFIQ